MAQREIAVWICPICGRTVTQEQPSYCQPNTTCQHPEMGCVVIMSQIAPLPQQLQFGGLSRTRENV
jgi:hypothetical protein